MSQDTRAQDDADQWIPRPLEPTENRFWRKAKENPFVPIGI